MFDPDPDTDADPETVMLNPDSLPKADSPPAAYHTFPMEEAYKRPGVSIRSVKIFQLGGYAGSRGYATCSVLAGE